MTTRISSMGLGLSAVAVGTLCVAACSSVGGEKSAATSAGISVCSGTVTKNSYDGSNYWGTIAVKNGSTAITGFSVSFDVPSDAHCTNDTVPRGATLGPLNGSDASATTVSNHCVFTWKSAALAAGASKTFNYSTDSSDFDAATNVVVTFAGCSEGGGRDTGAPPSPPGADAGPPDTVGGGGATDCDSPGLTWRTANKTNFTSYPDPGSAECLDYNGCAYEGKFAVCSQTRSKAWVSSHNVVAVFPNLNNSSNGIGALGLHDLCLKSGSKTIVVTVLDECADSDCSGCCTKNKGSADELIDIESFTNARWGVEDGPIEWADLGPTKTTGCN